MINISFAARFIHRIRAQTDYNVNIMNEHGIIIASCDEARVGTFHSTAFDMIKGNISSNELYEVTDNLCGVTSPGVNLLLRENLSPIGVLGVSGNPETVTPLAKIFKLSFVAFYDYEFLRSISPIEKSSGTGYFARLLLFDKPANITNIRAEAAKLRIIESIDRYPLLIKYTASQNIGNMYHQFVQEYHSSEIYSRGDILLELGKFLFLFKEIKQDSVGNYRNEISNCIGIIDKWFLDNIPGCKTNYICGTVQNSFLNYGKVYEDMMWLYRYPQKQDSKIYFLGNYLTEFMMNNFLTDAMSSWMDIYARLINDHLGRELFMETVGALVDSDMNLGVAARRLYLHKNTVALRVKKIRDILGLNPLSSMRDAIFIVALYTYIEKR